MNESQQQNSQSSADKKNNHGKRNPADNAEKHKPAKGDWHFRFVCLRSL